jgi:hypothetical protein
MRKPKTSPRTRNSKLNAKRAKQPSGASGARKPKRTPEAKPQPAKTTSKLATIIAMLRRPGGATIADLTTATKWQAHSVRGAMSGAIKKKRGLPVTSEKTDGARTYRIRA